MRQAISNENELLNKATELADALAHLELRDFPWRYVHDPCRVFLAELLLQRTTAAHAKLVYIVVLENYPTIQALGNAKIDELNDLLCPLGLSKRATYVSRAAGHLLEKHHGQIPCTSTELLAIPLVGPYTAAAILTHSFGLPIAAVDINVARVIARVFAFRPRRSRIHSDNRVKELARQVVDSRPRDAQRLDYAFLDVGAIACRSVPHCDRCPLRILCPIGTGTAPDPLVAMLN